ncbi:MAG: 1-acyl-sn-glycerol-3-phosphate acyltransferase [Clostridia bacterium]|nr:1-acyl-sn-glycerol-3-phosphate acyltransferase [Clostridia bacterium]
MLLFLTRVLMWIPISIFHPTFIKGKKNMPKGKAILCCNHRSNWDIALFHLFYTVKIKILAKKELFKNKLFGAMLKSYGGISIDRDANDIHAIKVCMKVLKDEQKLFIFPEGTRLKDEEKILGEIKSGLALIAIKTKTPIVPIWVKRKPKLFRKSVYIIGKPYELSEFYDIKLDEETLKQANQIVREKMLETRELSLKRKKQKGI